VPVLLQMYLLRQVYLPLDGSGCRPLDCKPSTYLTWRPTAGQSIQGTLPRGSFTACKKTRMKDGCEDPPHHQAVRRRAGERAQCDGHPARESVMVIHNLYYVSAVELHKIKPYAITFMT
jgi:hypothetical protein